MNSFESVIKGDYTILSWDFAEGGHIVRRCGKQKQVHIQTKNPATMINNCINESLVTSFQQYRETRRKCRPQALVKPKMWSVLQEGHLSPSKDLSPASASFPCCRRRIARLFMEISVSGWFAPRCASLPARFRRCRASAWRLGMAPVVWGPRPGSACEYHVEREERWATALSLDWWKRCQVQLYHVNAHIIQNLKNKTQSSTSWHFNIIWMCVIVVPIFHLQINSNLRVHLFCDFLQKRFDRHLRLKLATRHLFFANIFC